MVAISKPTLRCVPVNAPREEFIEAIKCDGGCICTNYVTIEDVTAANAEVKPFLDSENLTQAKLFPLETRRCNWFPWTSPTCREKVFMHPLYQELGEYFLSSIDLTWHDERCTYYTSHPLRSAALGIDVRPNAVGQRLHRDDKMYHTRHTDATRTGWAEMMGLVSMFPVSEPQLKTALRV
ncbi:Dioxygenase [Lachnellula willkommii]|uniref:Dioxygenase n=1 Tax=Lachnellula willkommii TaxID=215461 RepID=A0A559M504_9HELO|nr:Dioxygenase [Lachnellula willkommii]